MKSMPNTEIYYIIFCCLSRLFLNYCKQTVTARTTKIVRAAFVVYVSGFTRLATAAAAGVVVVAATAGFAVIATAAKDKNENDDP